MHFTQGILTEGLLYPGTVTLIVEHSEEYWACLVQVVGHHLGGYTHKFKKEDLERAKATKVGTPVVLEKRHGKVRLRKAPPGSEEILLPGALHLTKQTTYPLPIVAQFPRLRHDI